MIVRRKNLQHAQKLQKQHQNKHTKPGNYAPSDKVWLNSQYIKTKRSWKLKSKFFGTFQVLYPVGKQAYKIKLSKKWRIHDVFYMSLLEQDTTWKRQVDESTSQLEFQNDNKKYKFEVICDNKVYGRESKTTY